MGKDIAGIAEITDIPHPCVPQDTGEIVDIQPLPGTIQNKGAVASGRLLQHTSLRQTIRQDTQKPWRKLLRVPPAEAST